MLSFVYNPQPESDKMPRRTDSPLLSVTDPATLTARWLDQLPVIAALLYGTEEYLNFPQAAEAALDLMADCAEALDERTG